MVPSAKFLQERPEPGDISPLWPIQLHLPHLPALPASSLPGVTLESLLVPSQAVTELPGTRILVLAPHADDEVFGCGGAIMAHVGQGKTVSVVIFCDGVHGANPDTAPALLETRRGESVAAAQVLGYGIPRFLDYPDRGLYYDEQLIGEIQALCAGTGADLVYAPCVLEMHPDHRMLGMAAAEALRRIGAGIMLAQYEVGMPLRPNCLLDISTLLPRKEQAMACFVSQNARQRYDLHIAALNRYRSYTLPASVSAAEAFVLTPASELAADPLGLYRSEHARQGALGLPLTASDLPLVSVIVRSMDRPTLPSALDSVALQTYPNLELVLVNASGSPHHDYGQWCGRFPLRLVDPGKALGRSAAANAGLDAARGELLIFLDDDDCFLPHHVSALKACLDAADDSVIAAYSTVLCRDALGRETRRFERDYDAMWLRIENFIPIHALLFRRLPSTRDLRFDESMDHCEDWDFWLQLQEYGSFRFVAQPGAIYNLGNNSGSGIWDDEQLARAAVLHIYKKHLPHWSDAILWQVFELAHYKPLYVAACDTLSEQQAAAEQVGHALAERNAELEAARHALAERNAQLEAAGNQLHAQQQTNAELTLAVAERDQRIASLLASTSWRITRPLRQLARLLRGNSGVPDEP
jgi:LmbE family N-acetylglucosaminyl deacetylase